MLGGWPASCHPTKIYPMRNHVVPSGHAGLAVTEWGDGGLPIMALHPGVADSRIWQWTAPAWADAGHRVVAYDRRGFGHTRYDEEPHDDMADLRAVTQATSVRPAVIVGNSLGGGIALDLALAHPEEVLGLVLIAPSPSGYPYADWPATEAEAELDRLVAAAEEAGDLELVNRLEIRYWLDGTEQPEGRVAGPARDLMAEMNGLALRAASAGETTSRPPAWPRVEEITAPTLVVAGQHDLAGVIRTCERLTERLPDATSCTIAGSAHCPSLDQPESLNVVMLDFLGSVGGR